MVLPGGDVAQSSRMFSSFLSRTYARLTRTVEHRCSSSNCRLFSPQKKQVKVLFLDTEYVPWAVFACAGPRVLPSQRRKGDTGTGGATNTTVNGATKGSSGGRTRRRCGGIGDIAERRPGGVAVLVREGRGVFPGVPPGRGEYHCCCVLCVFVLHANCPFVPLGLPKRRKRCTGISSEK